MTLDAKARATALRLIAKFGKAVSYVVVTDGTYDPSTGAVTPTETSSTVKAVVQDYSLKDSGAAFASGLVREGDKQLIVAAAGLSFTPKPGDKVTLDGQNYLILNVKATYSGELVAIFELQGRKS